MYLEVARQTQEYFAIPDFIINPIMVIHPVVIAFTMLWVFLHFVISWPTAIVQLIYGVAKYSKFHNKQYLNHTCSAAIVCMLYGIVILLSYNGLYVSY